MVRKHDMWPHPHNVDGHGGKVAGVQEEVGISDACG